MAVEKELLEGITLIAEGKEEGFNILYSHTYNYVYSRAKFIMKNEEDALDLTQETFIQAYKGIGSLEDANNVYAWLGGIVYRQGMKIFRKRKELLVNEDSEDIFENILDEDKDFQPEENVQAKTTSEIVMGMVNELPELQRAAIVAFYYDNMKIDEIAQLFECSANTIKSRLNYAKKFLKTKVEEHERQNRYKLCAVSPAILFMSFKSLFTTEEYRLSESVANNVYSEACDTVGLAPTAIVADSVVVETVATEAEVIAGASEAVAVTEAAATANAGVIGTITAKAGVLFGSKIGIAIAAIVTAGAVGVGAFVYHNASKNANVETGNTAIVTEEALDRANDKNSKTEKAEQKEAKELIETIEEAMERRDVTETNVLDIEAVVSGVMSSSYETAVTATDQSKNSQIADVSGDLDERAQNILNEIITADMTEFLKVKAIHDYMVMNVDYDYDDYLADTIPASSYTAEGALDTGYVVCAGYAKLFKLLCNNAGIECDYVVGWGGIELHAWNQVKVDGEWYNVDVTWDDPVSLEKAFDDHLNNHYSYFLLSDADMNKSHTPYNAKHECTAPSIGNTAFDYYCPWLDNNPDLPFIRTDEELAEVVQRMLDEKIMSFEMIAPKAEYHRDNMSDKIMEATVKAGYGWSSISSKGNIGIADNYLKKWTMVMYQEPKEFEYFASEEDLKAFILEYVAQRPSKWTPSTYEEVSFYAATNDIDEAEISEWALLNGIKLLMGWGYFGEEVVPGYYYGVLGMSTYGYDILTSADEITANMQAAYDRGEKEYIFLYDYRNTGMSAIDAQYAIIYATPMGITNGHSVFSDDVDGLLLFCQYFR